ncbi:hypothetical protein CROQUDRAFT_88931, partial [Cronartium quercuum f. sp. fusiforme G11]
ITASKADKPGDDGSIFVFEDAKFIDKGCNPSSTFLGRPWGPYPNVILQNRETAIRPISANKQMWDLQPVTTLLSTLGFRESPKPTDSVGNTLKQRFTKEFIYGS